MERSSYFDPGNQFDLLLDRPSRLVRRKLVPGEFRWRSIDVSFRESPLSRGSPLLFYRCVSLRSIILSVKRPSNLKAPYASVVDCENVSNSVIDLKFPSILPVAPPLSLSLSLSLPSSLYSNLFRPRSRYTSCASSKRNASSSRLCNLVSFYPAELTREQNFKIPPNMLATWPKPRTTNSFARSRNSWKDVRVRVWSFTFLFAIGVELQIPREEGLLEHVVVPRARINWRVEKLSQSARGRDAIGKFFELEFSAMERLGCNWAN